MTDIHLIQSIHNGMAWHGMTDIHLIQSIHNGMAWHAKLLFVKDSEHILSIDTGSHAAWGARMLGVQSQTPGWKITVHLKKQCLEDWQMVSRVWSNEDIILISGRTWPSEDIILVSNCLDPFHQFRNKYQIITKYK